MRHASDFAAVVLGTILFAGFMVAGACIPKPTNQECHTYGDCRDCTINWCAWCGPRPGVKGLGRANAGSCYAPEFKPEGCDEPPHVTFCFQDSTTPIDNRMRTKRPDGGADGGDGR